jgi:hypothetical protein
MKLAQSDCFLIANKKKSSKRPVLPLRNSRDARQEGKPVHRIYALLSPRCHFIANRHGLYKFHTQNGKYVRKFSIFNMISRKDKV